MGQSSANLLIANLWILLLLWPLGLGAWWDSKPWRLRRYLRRHGRVATATVVGVTHYDHGDSDGDYLSLLIETPEGRMLTLEQVLDVATGTYAVGGQLMIQYDPLAPRRCLPTAQLHQPGAGRRLFLDTLYRPLSLGLFGLAIGLAGWLDQWWTGPEWVIEVIPILLILGIPWLSWVLINWGSRWWR